MTAWERASNVLGVKLPIYMDHHATTPVDPRVLERMLPYFKDAFGNAASRNHVFGWRAEEAVEAARQEVAKLIGATAREIVFTSGATESDNLAIFGVAEAYRQHGDHIVTQATEHKAVLDPCAALAKRGFQVTVLPVDATGLVDPAAVEAALTSRTILVSIMAANNEVGTLQPVRDIGAICRKRGVLFHSDATQAVGKVAFDVAAVDLASCSAHKLYGPKGVGALYVRRKEPRVTLAPMILGGGHERGLRSGTLNVPGIVGFGEAARLAVAARTSEAERLKGLRDRLYTRIGSGLDRVHLNGHPQERLPGTLNISIAGVEAEPLILALRDVAVSSGAACTSATLEPSHVLRAMGVPAELAHGSLRFGLGRFTTQEEVDYVADLVVEKARRLRELGGGALAGRLQISG